MEQRRIRFLRSTAHTMRKALLASLSSLLVASVLGQTSTGTSGSTSGGAVVLPAFDTFDSAYQIDWSVIFAANPPAAFSIPENTELGPCVCDLTFNQCDVNCKCDAVWSVTHGERQLARAAFDFDCSVRCSRPPVLCLYRASLVRFAAPPSLVLSPTSLDSLQLQRKVPW